MIPRVVLVEPLQNYCIRVEFKDGASGVIDVGKTLGFEGVFGKLADVAFFNRVRVGRTYKTVTWPGQLDLDPVMLYHRATGKKIEWILAQPGPDRPARKARAMGKTVSTGENL